MLSTMSNLKCVAKYFDFSGYRCFLSYENLKIEVKKAKVSSCEKYRKQYKNFNGWPGDPSAFYKKEWKGWNDLFGKKNKKFISYRDLKIAVKKAGISSYTKYKRQYKKFDSWPSAPSKFYKKEWKNWLIFFEKNKLSYRDLKIAVKKAGISSYTEYKRQYKKFEGWPCYPLTFYKKEWKGWPGLFDKR